MAQRSAQQIVFLRRWIKESVFGTCTSNFPLHKYAPSRLQVFIHMQLCAFGAPFPHNSLSKYSCSWPRPGSEVTSVTLFCSCPKQSRASGFFLCSPTAHFQTSIIYVALDSMVIFWYNVNSVRGKILSCSSSTHILKHVCWTQWAFSAI